MRSYHSFVAAAIILAVSACRPDESSGSGGSGGCPEPDDAGATCYPLQDNDPVACAANHCTMTSNGCGGEIRCDTVCSTVGTPASCTLDHGGRPVCALCDLAPTDDAFCAKDPEKSSAYHCVGQYPQPGACAAKTLNQGVYVACCGNPH